MRISKTLEDRIEIKIIGIIEGKLSKPSTYKWDGIFERSISWAVHLELFEIRARRREI